VGGSDAEAADGVDSAPAGGRDGSDVIDRVLDTFDGAGSKSRPGMEGDCGVASRVDAALEDDAEIVGPGRPALRLEDTGIAPPTTFSPPPGSLLRGVFGSKGPISVTTRPPAASPSSDISISTSVSASPSCRCHSGV
jgi:hypothetical protein